MSEYHMLSYKLYDKLYGDGSHKLAYSINPDELISEALVVILEKLERLEKKIK